MEKRTYTRLNNLQTDLIGILRMNVNTFTQVMCKDGQLCLMISNIFIILESEI